MFDIYMTCLACVQARKIFDIFFIKKMRPKFCLVLES